MHIAPALKLALAIGLFLISGGIGAWLYHRFRHGLSLDDKIDAALNETEGNPHESTISS
jgi:hypothetical protein